MFTYINVWPPFATPGYTTELIELEHQLYKSVGNAVDALELKTAQWMH